MEPSGSDHPNNRARWIDCIYASVFLAVILGSAIYYYFYNREQVQSNPGLSLLLAGAYLSLSGLGLYVWLKARKRPEPSDSPNQSRFGHLSTLVLIVAILAGVFGQLGKLFIYGLDFDLPIPLWLFGLYLLLNQSLSLHKYRRIAQISLGALILLAGTYLAGIQLYSLTDPSNRALFFGDRAAARGDCGVAYQLYEKSVSLNPNQGNAFNNWAWTLLTCPNKDLRNSQKALELSEKAAALPDFGIETADTVACAFAANGDFERATDIAEKFHLKDRLPLFEDSDQCE